MIKILGQIENNCLPDVETDRLLLRQRTVADAQDMLAYVSLPQVAVPIGAPLVDTLEDEIYYIEQIYPKRLKKERLLSGWGITLKGQDRVIGSVDFNKRYSETILEIGYALHPDYWGNGYVPEAATALLTVGFDRLGLEKVVLKCYDYNTQSQAVARKLGFNLVKMDGPVEDVTGRKCKDCVYELTDDEWRTVHHEEKF
ncbi:GNAT family N-acetyltransferase [Streptococcus castoreus]|uniref:GNAT family N-acetyltransferase n=1 Tax=Streptococcus castoreus TaxID=254786 RepID=UPI000420DAC6|nr:GNAT family protein [Streptococcus castoreus]